MTVAGIFRTTAFGWALTASAVAFAAPPPVPVYNLFKNWVVGCDNVRICEATGLATEADAPDGSDIPMAVTRAGGPDGELKVLIEAGVALDPASLKLDGKPLPPALLSILKPDPQSHGAALTSTDAAAADFLRSIRDGTRADHRLGRPDRHNAGVAAGPGGARVADRRTCRAGSAARRPWPGRDRRRHPMCRRLCSCHRFRRRRRGHRN